MGHIFISYSHKDNEYIHKLQDSLRNKGFKVWFDNHIDYGTEWPKAIQRRLDECDAFIVVMSENAYASTWVHNEVTRATRKKKPVFPLLLKGDPWIILEATQYIDVRDGSLPSEKFYENLARVISVTGSDGRVNEERIKHIKVKRLLTSVTFIIPVFILAILLVIYALFTRHPTISISNDVRDISGSPIDINNAPFQVSVGGIVSHADGLYVYLIVADRYHYYIQPGLGPNINNEFSNLGQLGQKDDPESYGQQYTIYVVVTDKPYAPFAIFDGENFIAKSKEVRLTREPLPIPTTPP